MLSLTLFQSGLQITRFQLLRSEIVYSNDARLNLINPAIAVPEEMGF